MAERLANTDIGLRMGALLRQDGVEGFDLTLRADGFFARIGWRLTSAVPGDPGVEVSLAATRHGARRRQRRRARRDAGASIRY